MHQDHGQSPAICQGAINLGFSSVMMDGCCWKTARPGQLRVITSTSRAAWSRWRTGSGVSVEGELGCLGNLETGEAGEEDGIGAEGKLDHSQMLTDPEGSRRLRQGDPARRARDRDRHQPRRLQSSAASPPATSWRSAA